MDATQTTTRTVRLTEANDAAAPCSYKLLIGSEVFHFIKNLKGHIFTASNGYSVKAKLKKGVQCKFTGTKLSLGPHGPLGLFKVHFGRPSNVVVDYGEFKRKLSALKTLINETLAAYRAQAPAEVAAHQTFEIVEIPNTLYFDVFISGDVYDAMVKRKRNLTFCGIHLAAKSDFKPGFGNGSKNTLYIDKSFRGKKVRIGPDFVGYGKLRKKKKALEGFFHSMRGWLDVVVDMTEVNDSDAPVDLGSIDPMLLMMLMRHINEQ